LQTQVLTALKSLTPPSFDDSQLLTQLVSPDWQFPRQLRSDRQLTFESQVCRALAHAPPADVAAVSHALQEPASSPEPLSVVGSGPESCP